MYLTDLLLNAPHQHMQVLDTNFGIDQPLVHVIVFQDICAPQHRANAIYNAIVNYAAVVRRPTRRERDYLESWFGSANTFFILEH